MKKVKKERYDSSKIYLLINEIMLEGHKFETMINMLFFRPNGDMIKEVRSKLITADLYRENSIEELRDGLIKKKAETRSSDFIKRGKLHRSIMALTYLLKKLRSEARKKSSPPPPSDPV